MEAEWSADRANLRLVLRDHPAWSVPQLAQHIGRSVSWVKKWRQRRREAPSEDEAVLHSRSRARKHPPPALSQLAIERILAMQARERSLEEPLPAAFRNELARWLADNPLAPRSLSTYQRLLESAGTPEPDPRSEGSDDRQKHDP